MVWHRLPTYLPSFPLRLVPLSQAQRATYEATGFVKDLVFKTVPRVGKLELKEYLTKIYGFDIATLRTSVLAGKKKRGKAGNSYARPDIKKVYVTLKPPSTPSSSQ